MHLDKRAQDDELFAVSYSKEGKNIDDCITYILNAVHKSGCNGFAADEILGMAVHYYDEDKIDIGNPIDCKVVVNHTVALTDEEIEDARKKAIEKVTSEQIAKLKAKPIAPNKEKKQVVEYPSLF